MQILVFKVWHGRRMLLRFLCLIGIAIAFSAAEVFATSVLPQDLNQLVVGSERIAHVRCLANEAVPDPTVGIVTVTTFAVLDTAKGTAATALTVRQIGGELNGVALRAQVPRFAVGDEYVLFMPPTSSIGLASPVGLSQGVFGVVQGTSGEEVGNGRDFTELLSGMNAASMSPGAAALLRQMPEARRRMRLADFMELVRTTAAR